MKVIVEKKHTRKMKRQIPPMESKTRRLSGQPFLLSVVVWELNLRTAFKWLHDVHHLQRSSSEQNMGNAKMTTLE